MKRLSLLLTAFLMATLGLQAADDSAIAARNAAFDLAGAFTANDGYKLRDGFFTAALKSGESKIFAVNLYSGNSYWFCVATAPVARKVEVAVFDETGKPVAIQRFADLSRAAAGLTALTSGVYYVKISLMEGNGAELSTACLLYAYK